MAGLSNQQLDTLSPDEIAGYLSNNTRLTPELEQAYQQWIAKQSAMKGRDVNFDQIDYDSRAALAAGLLNEGFGHGSDVGKKPNHPTFSDQSIYSTPEHLGGHWGVDANGKGTYAPTASMMIGSPQRAKLLANYLQKHEQGTALIPIPGYPLQDQEANPLAFFRQIGIN